MPVVEHGGSPALTDSGRVTASSSVVRRHVIGAAAVTALGGLLFGYDTGVVSGALLFLKSQFGGLSSFQQELVTSEDGVIGGISTSNPGRQQ